MKLCGRRALQRVLAVTCVVLAVGCSAEPSPGPGPGPRVVALPGQPAPLPRPDLGTLDLELLRERAGIATRDGRVHAPVGDNAVEYYLELHSRLPDSGPTRLALEELQPYVVIATEQAVGSGQFEEAQRLIGMLRRMDAQAPSLPRLIADLSKGREREAARRAAREAEADAIALAATIRAASPASPGGPPAGRVPVESVAPANPSPAGIPPAQDAATASRPSPRGQAPAAAPMPPPVAVGTRGPEPSQAPRLIVEVAPRYPGPAMNRRIEGSVEVAFTVQPDGSVSDIAVVAANPPGVFERAAVAAVAAYRFDRSAAPVTLRRTLNFRLPGSGQAPPAGT